MNVVQFVAGAVTVYLYERDHNLTWFAVLILVLIWLEVAKIRAKVKNEQIED